MNQILIPVMQNEEKILELLAEVLHKVDVLSVEVNGIKGEVNGIKVEVKGLKDNVAKLNIISAENTRALMKLADNTEKRLSRLEKAVFK